MEKKCASRECSKKITSGSSKKKFCSIACKNKESYLQKCTKEADLINWTKGHKLAEKIISIAYDAGSDFLTQTTLVEMGVNPKYFMAPMLVNEAQSFELGKFILSLEPDKKTISINLKKQ